MTWMALYATVISPMLVLLLGYAVYRHAMWQADRDEEAGR